MAEYIEREAVIERLTGLFQLQAETAKAIVEAIPAADVVERKKGTWRKEMVCGGFREDWDYTCSVCGAVVHNPNTMNYCPCCGADMRGVTDEES